MLINRPLSAFILPENQDRATAIGQAARLVAVTGYGQPDDRERTRAAGFDEHLLKPLGEAALLGALARCMPQPQIGD